MSLFPDLVSLRSVARFKDAQLHIVLSSTEFEKKKLQGIISLNRMLLAQN